MMPDDNPLCSHADEHRGRRAFWWTTAVALAAGLVAHFALVLVSVLPPNPISESLPPGARGYLLPRFAQDWRLFAPAPVADDYTAYVRGIYLDGGSADETEWLDFTTPVIHAVRANRFSQQNLVWTMLLSAMYDLGSRLGPRDGLARRLLLESWADPARQPQSLVVLETSGSAALAAAHPGVRFRAVRIMLAIQPPLRFRERRAPEAERPPVEYVTFPPIPFQQIARWDSAP